MLKMPNTRICLMACVEYKNMMNGQQLLRAVKAEARITINGKSYNVGGLYGQKQNAYLLPEWMDQFTRGENDFQLAGYEVSELKPFIHWKSDGGWASNRK